MWVHFIAIGGSAMHNLAIALHKKGYKITGSDDEIAEPSYSRLQGYGLLPESIGWNPDRIDARIDAVILGMHARADNPELKKAHALGLRIYSYPEYIYEQTKHKKRVVVGGSHGKTTITSMILHVLNYHRLPHDYMVGAQLEGYECMVGLSEEAPVAVLEGDEYLSSPEDRRPKFHLYHPDIAVLSGIAWDHINVFPTFENYVDQFRIFIEKITSGGSLIYSEDDEVLPQLVQKAPDHLHKTAYTAHPHRLDNGTTLLLSGSETYPIQVFGLHNLRNLSAAKQVCLALGLREKQFYEAIPSFKGAARRLELLRKNETAALYRDFAHSPSKLKATIEAVKTQFPVRRLRACMELHTFSSLNAEFLKEYEGSMQVADEALLYFNPQTLAHKKLESITPEQVRAAFGRDDLQVFTESEALRVHLLQADWTDSNLLLMSSGTFGGIDLNELAQRLIP